MRKYIKRISKEKEYKLKQVINSTFLGFYSTNVDIDPILNQYIFFNGSIFYEQENKRSFINISNEWLETELDNDYYQLDINFEDKPSDIEFKNNAVYNSPVNISYKGIQHIIKIEIYSSFETDENEEINFDSYLLFYFNDKNVLVVSTLFDISGRLVLKICNEKQIQKEVERLHLRVLID